MNSQELRALQESYNQVYQLDEISDRKVNSMVAQRRRQFNRADEGGSAREIHLARNLVKAEKSAERRSQRLNREQVDLYDIVLSHLLDEGYADTEQAAEAIIVNMSEDWRKEILDEAITSEKGKAKAAEMIAARTTASGRAGTYKESFNIFVNSMIAEGVSMERYTWEEIQNVFDDLFEAQVANRNPDEYERKAKQGQSREQQLKGRVMGRMSQMDPDKKAAMLKQMRAVGLDV